LGACSKLGSAARAGDLYAKLTPRPCNIQKGVEVSTEEPGELVLVVYYIDFRECHFTFLVSCKDTCREMLRALQQVKHGAVGGVVTKLPRQLFHIEGSDTYEFLNGMVCTTSTRGFYDYF
jgi:hypothetical protein